MKIMSKLLGWLMIISVFAIVITTIISAFHFDDYLLQCFLYEISIFLISFYSKDMFDAELLERKIKEEMRKLEEKELSRSKSDENT
ncbi:hypothetical protein ACNYMP_10080 [Ligilactobacillus salivarius]|uniref:hypothetical protein n=1 Tax=Ligilactobacillus salivarius TaxID=1624 RepID=UPI003AB55697